MSKSESRILQEQLFAARKQCLPLADRTGYFLERLTLVAREAALDVIDRHPDGVRLPRRNGQCAAELRNVPKLEAPGVSNDVLAISVCDVHEPRKRTTQRTLLWSTVEIITQRPEKHLGQDRSTLSNELDRGGRAQSDAAGYGFYIVYSSHSSPEELRKNYVGTYMSQLMSGLVVTHTVAGVAQGLDLEPVVIPDWRPLAVEWNTVDPLACDMIAMLEPLVKL